MKDEGRMSRLLVAAALLFAAAPAAAQDANGAAGAVVGAVDLPRDLSPVGMFLNADLLVKAVIAGLVFASVLTWTVWLAKTVELVAARRRLRAGMRALASARTLADAADAIGPAGDFVDAAALELSLSGDLGALAGVKERVASRLDGIEMRRARRLNRGTGMLATIGATAPFVGLFGTVWGIMNSFIGIAKAHTTNLAVVAPGIAEALLATAFGLAAAIPAVVVYNLFSRQLAGYRALLAEASAEVARLASRDVDRPVARRASAEARRFAAAAE